MISSIQKCSLKNVLGRAGSKKCCMVEIEMFYSNLRKQISNGFENKPR